MTENDHAADADCHDAAEGGDELTKRLLTLFDDVAAEPIPPFLTDLLNRLDQTEPQR